MPDMWMVVVLGAFDGSALRFVYCPNQGVNVPSESLPSRLSQNFTYHQFGDTWKDHVLSVLDDFCGSENVRSPHRPVPFIHSFQVSPTRTTRSPRSVRRSHRYDECNAPHSPLRKVVYTHHIMKSKGIHGVIMA
ncbi:uncharacterized protein B0T23DRAFT_384810 [Neurospora hispaniola]|uniref:Uncharacterized protein n=1 Tax=Neurospora hispaniola TaxID=588809 RepID=A0AAJ0I406_9PEZI|nr:hypothetical protein B0T23DRAFT_384810 [Neurospora hispaniola]